MAPVVDRRSLLALAAAAAALPAAAFARGPDEVPPPDREAMVPVEGGRIYVRMNGRVSADRPPLLLIHGGPGSAHAYLTPLLALADERAVLLYDQLDAGRSDRPGDPRNWRVERFVDEIDGIRHAFGLERLNVCGHSWGGTIALGYGARRPAGLAGAALASPLISTRSWLADANERRRELPADTRAVLDRCESAEPPPAADCGAATDAFYARFLIRTAPDPAAVAYARRFGVTENTALYRAMWGASEFVSTGTLSDYDGEPLLARLDGPRTLFVCGQYDEARPATVAGFAARVPGSEFAVVPGAGHVMSFDRPDEFVALLRGWMRRRDAA